MNVLVWYENKPLPEAVEAERRIYPNGIHGALGELFVTQPDFLVRTRVMQDTGQGLTDEDLDWTNVLVYFSHKHWRDIADDRVAAMQKRVLEGMGLLLLHSSHASKIFSRLMGTRTQCLRWREADEWQRVWTVNPAHPIAQGLEKEYFIIPKDETYGEYFEIPQPDEQVFLTTSQGGEVLRSGCCWYRGLGRIFYFSSGHETYPVYYQSEVRQILINAVRWVHTGNKRIGWPNWARESGFIE
ncbi:MAG TPA: trehalose utilization protein ThuA [Christensenellaceae bacterium]|jgi:trehalose utilization protein|nr:trehalose utilization protein ThuA [Christensenellaceae bacterium]